MALTALIVGLLGQGPKQDGRERAQLIPAGRRADGSPIKPYIRGRGQPSLVFIILIIAALAFAALNRAGSVAIEPVG